jgi:molybdate transport system regulatory protein
MSGKPEVKLWIKLELAGKGEIGPGKIALLRRIREHGSISAAARSMSMSYRRAWELVDELNHLFDAPLVETHIGGSSRGGARVTDLGATIIDRYDAIGKRSASACHDLLNHFLSK